MNVCDYSVLGSLAGLRRIRALFRSIEYCPSIRRVIPTARLNVKKTTDRPSAGSADTRPVERYLPDESIEKPVGHGFWTVYTLHGDSLRTEDRTVTGTAQERHAQLNTRFACISH